MQTDSEAFLKTNVPLTPLRAEVDGEGKKRASCLSEASFARSRSHSLKRSSLLRSKAERALRFKNASYDDFVNQTDPLDISKGLFL